MKTKIAVLPSSDALEFFLYDLAEREIVSCEPVEQLLCCIHDINHLSVIDDIDQFCDKYDLGENERIWLGFKVCSLRVDQLKNTAMSLSPKLN